MRQTLDSSGWMATTAAGAIKAHPLARPLASVEATVRKIDGELCRPVEPVPAAATTTTRATLADPPVDLPDDAVQDATGLWGPEDFRSWYFTPWLDVDYRIDRVTHRAQRRLEAQGLWRGHVMPGLFDHVWSRMLPGVRLPVWHRPSTLPIATSLVDAALTEVMQQAEVAES